MKRSTTKRALLMSALSMFLCFTMLIGTTFAWFTDTVESGTNQIVAGNLDVELYHSDKTATDEKVDVTTTLFDDVTSDKWEPGAMAYEIFTVENKGNLALKYRFTLNAVNPTIVNTDDGSYSFASVLKVAVITDENYSYSRENILADTELEWNDLATFNLEEKLAIKEKDVYGIVIWWQPGDLDNLFNMNNEKQGEKVSIEVGVSLFATQLNAESDSFNSDYDVDAPIIPAWSGEAGELPDADENGVISIGSAEELAAFANAVNGVSSVTAYSTRAASENFAGKTIKLTSDINLGNEPWTPIGGCDTPTYFQGTFDGQGYTIYGLNVDNSTDEYKYSTAGLFGWIDAAGATIKNVNIDGATVKGSHWVGAVVGYMTGDIINCTVTNSTVMGYNVNDEANGDKVGGIVGYMNTGAGSLVGNTVSNTTVIGYRDVAGVAGAVATTNSVKNNKVDNVIISAEADYVGEIVSAKTAVVVDETNVATGVAVAKGEMVAEGVLQLGTKSYAVTSKQGLLNANEIIQNTSSGEGQSIKVKLLCDVDLAGETWRPIDKMWVEFDGNGHTISNLKTEAWKAGLFGYLGGGYVKNLTLENVDVTGAQAGAFAGAIEGTIDNCVLKGDNKITYVEKHQYDDPAASVEAWGGIGAITGITQPCTVNATIAEGATVTLDYGAIETEAAYVDKYIGYIGTNKGVVTNNGTITTIWTVDSNDEFTEAVKNGAAIVKLAAGEYDLKGNQKDGLKIIGIEDGVNVANTTNYASGKTTGAIWQAIDLENVTVTDTVYTMADGGSATFTKVTFAAGVRRAYGSNVVFDNCKFGSNSEGYALHFESDAKSEGGNIVLSGCEFLGGKVHLGSKRAYTFTGCEFATGTDFQVWSNITLENCTVNGVTVDASNIASLFPNLNQEKVTIK